MKLAFEQLDAHLNRGLASLYLLSGDEPLQRREAADAIRARARAEGFDEREVLHAEAGFDWNALRAAGAELSLFSSRRLIDLRIPNGKPGREGGAALAEYAARPPEDTLLLVTLPKLDRSQQNSNWFKALEKAGAWLPLWPVELRQLPGWIERRMRARGLQPEREACALLAERVEGNLLAADQEIEKLFLLLGAGPVSAADVATAVADSARFDVYTLVDSALQGSTARAVRILDGLRAEGVDPVLILWALAREVRELAGMARELGGGGRIDAVLAAHRVWQARKVPVSQALKRHGVATWYALVRRCAHLDRVVKGAAAGSAWDELLNLVTSISGRPAS